jgi:hypothetical protein
MLEEFKGDAESGQVITPSEIKKKYDELIGRETDPSFIYTVLARHGWRKVMPRSQHPNKASDEEIESSKKLNLVWKNCKTFNRMSTIQRGKFA